MLENMSQNRIGIGLSQYFLNGMPEDMNPAICFMGAGGVSALISLG